MDLMQVGVHRSVIALWLGHERAETTQIHVEATLAMTEQALAMTTPRKGDPERHQPPDSLLVFPGNL